MIWILTLAIPLAALHALLDGAEFKFIQQLIEFKLPFKKLAFATWLFIALFIFSLTKIILWILHGNI